MNPNSQGIDTIELIVKYAVFKKMADKMGLTMQPMAKSHKRYEKLNDEVETDSKARRNKSNFKPIVELIQLPKVNPKDKYLQIVIIRNTPLLFDVATHHKKAKDNYCLITIAGLHQPNKKISSDAMKIVSKFLKRKAFKLYSLDIAKDIKDPKPINKEGLEAFKERFKPYSMYGVKLVKGTFYIDRVNTKEHSNISKIKQYDKHKKSSEKKEKVSLKDRHWKRLEVTLTFDVTKPNSFNFMEYINSMDFLNDFSDIERMAKDADIKKYSNDYLEYQITSLLDNRFLNNSKNKKQFNLIEALDFFIQSESKLKRSLPT